MGWKWEGSEGEGTQVLQLEICPTLIAVDVRADRVDARVVECNERLCGASGGGMLGGTVWDLRALDWTQ